MNIISRSCVALLFAALALSLPGRRDVSGAPSAPREGVLAAIQENAVRVYEAYDGVEARRHAFSLVYDSRTGELVESSEVLMLRREYFRRRPEFTALRYVKNGEELPPEKFGYRTRDPMHLPFDRDNDANYEVRIVGESVVNGERCYEVDISPRRRTARHFSGRAFFSVRDLALLFLEGTLADNPFGVKSLRLRIHFRRLGAASVIERGEYRIEVHIPVLYPHRRIVHSFTSSDDRLIPRNQN